MLSLSPAEVAERDQLIAAAIEAMREPQPFLLLTFRRVECDCGHPDCEGFTQEPAVIDANHGVMNYVGWAAFLTGAAILDALDDAEAEAEE